MVANVQLCIWYLVYDPLHFQSNWKWHNILKCCLTVCLASVGIMQKKNKWKRYMLFFQIDSNLVVLASMARTVFSPYRTHISADTGSPTVKYRKLSSEGGPQIMPSGEWVLCTAALWMALLNVVECRMNKLIVFFILYIYPSDCRFFLARMAFSNVFFCVSCFVLVVLFFVLLFEGCFWWVFCCC